MVKKDKRGGKKTERELEKGQEGEREDKREGKGREREKGKR